MNQDNSVPYTQYILLIRTLQRVSNFLQANIVIKKLRVIQDVRKFSSPDGRTTLRPPSYIHPVLSCTLHSVDKTQ